MSRQFFQQQLAEEIWKSDDDHEWDLNRKSSSNINVTDKIILIQSQIPQTTRY